MLEEINTVGVGAGFVAAIGLKIAWVIAKAAVAAAKERAKKTKTLADDAALSVVDSALGPKPPKI